MTPYEQVISQQKEQIARYETRLKDVVRAYKGLAKEKETLETSLKVITDAVKEEESERDDATDTDCETGSTAGSEAASQGPKLAALSSSLATVTAEKSQSEAKFLADKRKMKKERDELVAELEKLRKSEEEVRTSFEETKSKLIIEKHEREKEMNNNKLMMQEMQKLLTEEKRQNEKLNEDLLEAKSKVITLEDPSKSKQFEHQVRALQLELDDARRAVARSEKQLKDQSVTEQNIAALRTEMEDMKRKHWEQLQGADTGREAAELRVLEVQSSQEKRVVNLEARLTELSQSVGNYEKLRQQDQSAMASMREQIDHLSIENRELSRAATASPPVLLETEDVPMSNEKAIEQVQKLKVMLVERQLENLETLFQLPGQENLIEKCRALQQRLDANKAPSPGKLEEFLSRQGEKEELEKLRGEREDLLSKVTSLRLRSAEQDKEVNEGHQSLLELKQQVEKERERLQLEGRKQVAALRLELQEQRQTALTLMEEKDQEIQKLRGQVETAVEEAFYRQSPGLASSREGSASPGTALPRRVSVEGSLDLGRQEASSSGPPLHYVQELSRKEVELKELRSQQYQAETSLRELQLNMSGKEERYQDRIEELEDTVRRLERMTTVEGASQEYLKNVVLNYMLSTDMGSKNHMLKAIGAVLRLTDKEVAPKTHPHGRQISGATGD